jgi:hypothetical protein
MFDNKNSKLPATKNPNEANNTYEVLLFAIICLNPFSIIVAASREDKLPLKESIAISNFSKFVGYDSYIFIIVLYK